MEYNSLIEIINANIKANGRQAITGDVMNAILNRMVAAFGAGYQYMGMATPNLNPDSPDYKAFWLATEGTYTHMGGIEVGKELAVIKWDTAWSKEETGVVTTARLIEILSGYVTTETLTEALRNKQDTLISGENIKTINGQSVLGEGDIVIQGGSADAVKYTEQTLTDSQKTQARTNIAAASESEVSQLRSDVDGVNVIKANAEIGGWDITSNDYYRLTNANRVGVGPFRLNAGDKIVLSDYSVCRMYIGWKTADGTNGASGWKTEDYTASVSGLYVVSLEGIPAFAVSETSELTQYFSIVTSKTEADKNTEVVISLSENKLDKAIGTNILRSDMPFVADCILSNTGGLITHSSYSAYKTTKDFIPVKPETNYSRANEGYQYKKVCFYDKELRCLSYVSEKNTFTTPLNTAFVRISFYASYGYDMVCESSSTKPYEPYSEVGGYLDGIVSDLRSVRNEVDEYLSGDYDMRWEIGNISIGVSGWIYTNSSSRVRLKEGTTLSLKGGDVIGLTDYSAARYYVGWRRKDGTYGFQGWLQCDYIISEDAEYTILITHIPEATESSTDSLSSMFFLQNNHSLTHVNNQSRKIIFDFTTGSVAAYTNRYIEYTFEKGRKYRIVMLTKDESVDTYFSLRNDSGNVVNNQNNIGQGYGYRFVDIICTADATRLYMSYHIAGPAIRYDAVLLSYIDDYPGSTAGYSDICGNTIRPYSLNSLGNSYRTYIFGMAKGDVILLEQGGANTYGLYDSEGTLYSGISFPFIVDRDDYVSFFAFKNPAVNVRIIVVGRNVDTTIKDRVSHALDSSDLVRTPSILAGVNHRGYNLIAPENTLTAYKYSAANGFTYIETDVQFTSDGVPVLLHDPTINRTARNADGSELASTVNINSITYAEALEYDFGIYKGAEFAGEKIARFDDFIVLCRNLGLKPLIEIKVGTEAQIVGLQKIVRGYGMRSNVIWISFSAALLTYIKNADPFASLMYVKGNINSTSISEALALRTDYNEVSMDSNSYTTEEVQLCKDAGLPLGVWTLNNEAAILALDPYISFVTSDNLNAGKIMYKKDSLA